MVERGKSAQALACRVHFPNFRSAVIDGINT